MNKVFDVIQTLDKKVKQFLNQNDRIPASIAISPKTYCRLIQIKAWKERLGNLIIGCRPIAEVEIQSGTLKIIIDEMLSDDTIEIA